MTHEQGHWKDFLRVVGSFEMLNGGVVCSLSI